MLEGGGSLFILFRERHPGLYAEQLVPALSGLGAGALGVGHALASDHPVDLARIDDLVGAKGIPMLELPLVEVGNGGEADMRMM